MERFIPSFGRAVINDYHEFRHTHEVEIKE
jgi:hypothetical protein